MCIICQTATIGASLLTGVLPVAQGAANEMLHVPPATVAIATPAANSSQTLVATPAARSTPAKVGTGCRTVGATLRNKKATLVCKRVGKKLVWTRAATTSKEPGTTTTTTIAAPQTVGNFAPDSQCADQETPRTTYWQVSAGFPKFAERLPSSGTVRVLMLPVDFPDAVALGSPATDMIPITRALSDVYGTLSNGAVNLTFATLPSYLRVSRESTSWGMTAWGGGRGDVFVADIVRELDPQVDFSGVDAVVVMTPPTIGSNQVAYSPAMPYPARAPLATNEKSIHSATMAGYDAWRDPMTIVHEFGHLFGWLDTYVLPYPSGPYEDGHQFTGKWDFMGFAWTRGTFGWHRFLQGWLEDAEVLCAVAAGEYVATLAPLGATTKSSELLLLRGVSGKLVGVEVRRPGPVDGFVTAATQGVLVYTIDASGGTGLGPLRVQGLSLNRSDYYANAPLKPGQTLVVDGWTISVSTTTNIGDTVRASR